MSSLPAALPAAPPRFRHVPLFTSSAGRDAVDLAAFAGLDLDPWQQEVLVAGLAEAPDGRWAAMEVGLVVPRQNGKGGILEALELFGLFLDDRCELITHTAHRFDTCLDHFRRVRQLIEGNADLLGRVRDNGRGVGGVPSGIKDSNGKESIELRSGARIAFKARSKGSGRGFSGDLVVLDEAFWLQDLGSLVPTLSAQVNPQVWYASSAPLPREESDRLRKVVRRGRALAAGDHVDPVEPSLTYLEWSAPPDASLDDPGALRGANPAMEVGRITERFSRVERTAMDDDEYARERLGIFPDADDEPQWLVVGEADWAACASELAAGWLADPVTLAVEVTPDHRWASIGAAGAHGDGVALEVVDHREGTDWLLDRLVELHGRHSPKALLIDPQSPAGKSTSLLRDLEAAGITVTEVASADYARACGTLLDATVARTVTHHHQAELDEAVAHAAKRTLGDAWVFDRRGTTVVTPLATVALARWGHLEVEVPPPDWDFILVDV